MEKKKKKVVSARKVGSRVVVEMYDPKYVPYPQEEQAEKERNRNHKNDK